MNFPIFYKNESQQRFKNYVLTPMLESELFDSAGMGALKFSRKFQEKIITFKNTERDEA